MKIDLPKISVNIRLLSSSDVDAADEITQQAFLSPERRREELNRYLTLQPQGWRLAEVEGRPVGLVGAIDYGPFAWIGYMAVLPDLQNLGIGRALMTDLLNWLDERRCPMVRLDASDAGAILYEKIGFAARSQTLLFIREEPTPIKTREDSVLPLQWGDIPAIADFDELIFGARRDLLFKILLADFPGRAFFTSNESGQISGFLFAQTQKIGPWAANTPEEALALLSRAMKLRYEDPPKVVTPIENLEAINVLARAGFVQKDPHLHMIRGRSVLPGRRENLYGQTSYAVG